MSVEQGSKGRVAIITGASAGIGRDLTHLFAADGHDVMLVARREPRLIELAEILGREHGVNAYPLALDLSEPEAPGAVIAALEREGLVAEFLVNNAGFGSNGPFAEAELTGELGQIDLNVRALVHLTHLLLPGMLARGRGRVLNIGSIAGFQAGPYMATYYATKAFVNSFSEALSHEVAGTGVSVTLSCPGPTATEFGEIAGNDKTPLFKQGVVAASKDVAKGAYEAMMSGKRIAIHGLANKIGVTGARLGPRGLIQKLASRLNRP